MKKKITNLSSERLVAFSDGVIAIIITLMILSIRFPDMPKDASSSEIWQQLSTMLPSIAAYIVSFFALGVFWANHHQFFHLTKFADRNLLWLNLNLLFWLSLIPLPTAFLADHYDKPEATTLYGSIMFLCNAFFGVMFYYANRNNLFLDKFNKKRVIQITRMIFWSCVLWLVSIIIGYISVYISYVLYLVIALMFFLPQNIELEDDEQETK